MLLLIPCKISLKYASASEDQRIRYVNPWNTMMKQVDSGITNSQPFYIFETRAPNPPISKLTSLLQLKRGKRVYPYLFFNNRGVAIPTPITVKTVKNKLTLSTGIIVPPT